MRIKLNLGAGSDIHLDALNVDKRALPGIDRVLDLDTHPWDLPTDAFDEISALDIFEHLDDVVAVMDDCWRVLRAGGVLVIRAPSPNSPNLWLDVTHRRAFALNSFDYFDWTTDFGKKYRYGAHSWRVIEKREIPDAVTFRLEPVK